MCLDAVNNILSVQCNLFLLNFTYFAVVSNELNAVARINFTGTEIAHLNTHFNYLISLNFANKNVLLFSMKCSHVEQVYGKESHFVCQLLCQM